MSEIQEFKDLILREQSQVQELQRLAEERIRREMDEFREEFEKRRRKDELRQEHLWSEQDKYNREVVEQFPPLEHDLRVHEMLVQHLWKLQESYSNYFLGTAQSWLDGLQASVRERDDKVRDLEEEWQRQRRNAELYASQAGQRRTPGVVAGEAPALPTAAASSARTPPCASSAPPAMSTMASPPWFRRFLASIPID